MQVKIKKLRPEAVIPSKAYAADAALDLTAIGKPYVYSTATSFIYSYNTGIALAIPSGHVGLIFPRSSISKYDLRLANSVGVIDSNYRGEILVKFQSPLNNGTVYQPGDRIAQLIILPIPEIQFDEVEELSDTERGDGGFGSSGP